MSIMLVSSSFFRRTSWYALGILSLTSLFLLLFSPLLALLPSIPEAHAATRLGRHVTQEESNIWRQRAQSGPYKTQGDVPGQPYSPGDWTRVTKNATSFFNNPTGQHLFGQTTDSCVQLRQNIIGNRANGEPLRDAAFYYLVTGNTDYRSKVLTELLSQASEPGWDFTNTARWCIKYPGGLQGDGAPTFEVTMWLNKLLFGYDYLLAGDRVYGQLLSAADKTKLDNWFLNAGLFWEKETRVILENRFPNRGPGDWLSGDYSTPWGSAGGNCVNMYYGSPLKCDFQEAWQHRGAAKARFWGLVGVMMNNTLLKNQAKRYFREWLTYATWPDGSVDDMSCWHDDINPTTSFELWSSWTCFGFPCLSVRKVRTIVSLLNPGDQLQRVMHRVGC